MAGYGGEVTERVGAAFQVGGYIQPGQLDGGGFVSVAPAQFGLNIGTGFFVGYQFGDMKGFGSSLSFNSPFGGVSDNFDETGNVVGQYFSLPSPKAGLSGGFVKTCQYAVKSGFECN